MARPGGSAGPRPIAPQASTVRRIAPTFCGSSTSSSTTISAGPSAPFARGRRAWTSARRSTSATTPWCAPRFASRIEHFTRHASHAHAAAPPRPAVVATAHRHARRHELCDATGLDRLEHRIDPVDDHRRSEVNRRPEVQENALKTILLGLLTSLFIFRGHELIRLVSRPLAITLLTLRVLAIFSSGSPSSMRSASLPASIGAGLDAQRAARDSPWPLAARRTSTCRPAGTTHQLAVQVDGVRRVGAGHDERAGLHDVEHHLAAGRPGSPPPPRPPSDAAAAATWRLNPLGIQPEARIVLQIRIGLRTSQRAAVRRSSAQKVRRLLPNSCTTSSSRCCCERRDIFGE